MEEWATDALDVEGAPPVLAELATSRGLDLSALSQIFDEVPGQPDRRRVAHAIIGALGRELVAARIDTRSACALAWKAATIVDLDEADKYAIDALDDGLIMAEQGIYGDADTAREDAVRFLSRFVNAAADLPVRLTVANT
ncbi:MAG: hypothetical protein HYV09_28255 [Deltaproteobacteria bacterium]|nr:hypothetical protein [Deltaproteobacteria bacterium]